MDAQSAYSGTDLTIDTSNSDDIDQMSTKVWAKTKTPMIIAAHLGFEDIGERNEFAERISCHWGQYARKDVEKIGSECQRNARLA